MVFAMAGSSPNILARRVVGIPIWVGGAGAFAMFIVGLSLSDRAPAFTERWVKRLGMIFENRSGLDFIDRSDVPWDFDVVGHFFLWGLAGLLAWFALGRRVSGPFLIAGLIAISAGIEFVQPILSSTRKSQPDDLKANALGITLGVAVAWLAVGVKRSLSWVRNVRA